MLLRLRARRGAKRIRSERAAWLTFAVVGGGPTGVELAGTLAEIARHTLRKEFRHIDPRRAQVHLIEAGPARAGGSSRRRCRRARGGSCERLGVDVLHRPRRCTAIDATAYRLGDELLPARTVLWAAGVAASPLARCLGRRCDRAGRVPVSAGPHACPATPRSSSPATWRRSSAGRRQAGARRRARGQADGPPRRARDPRAAAGRAAAGLSSTATTATSPPSAAWPRWSTCARLQLFRPPRLVVLARRARVLPDRLSQPAGGADQLGLVVLDLPARRASSLVAARHSSAKRPTEFACAPVHERALRRRPHVRHCRVTPTNKGYPSRRV